ncbi:MULTISPECIES: DUF2550 family protein [unclassified Actinomyces]|uniref:DUF2550 family protein n=1 Tax=unclassified Actinomyces TaxID=2609248 RepID=UPI0020170BC1|nr:MULTISPECIES: DUF2550 family protein [unclassified Actinomyces]MCL3777665.1 DUF2550 domain-containing protein [Actinomyces sp. AC-20-1]MCL3789769.1 DUF2550 domain-containing protein [Actinomyces sp. 187325]MCL3791964.1 DUF2550 domain-containing protein [Actinomyces sp. 186855]MCL3794626.1 DUF2550 domain-containing protein [Actinomyces sp. 217892]
MATAGWCALGLVALVLLLAVAFLLRIRVLASSVGSFECALRPAGTARLMSGVAAFGDEAITWHRLVSLSPWPRYRMAREVFEINESHPRGADGRVIDVSCTVGGQRLELAMLEDSHSALVAWLESAAPSQPRLF